MSYRLGREEDPGKAVSRIICEQIDQAVQQLQHDKDPDADTVHRVRVGCKKIRAALRMIRSELGGHYHDENAWFREVAAKLATLRDADVMVTTLEYLQIHAGEPLPQEDFLWIRERLQNQFRQVLQETDREMRLTEAIESLEQGRARMLACTIPAADFGDLRPGLKKTLKRAGRGFEAALKTPAPEVLHEWRKRIKYHMYHSRMLRNLWPRPMKGYAKSLNDLSDLLGEAHDLDVFRTHLAGQKKTFGGDQRLDRLLNMAESRRHWLTNSALTLGTKVHAEKPKRWCDRMEAYWNAWRSDLDHCR